MVSRETLHEIKRDLKYYLIPGRALSMGRADCNFTRSISQSITTPENRAKFNLHPSHIYISTQ